MRGRHAPRAIVTARYETPTAPSEDLETATGRPCVPALPSNWQQLEDARTSFSYFLKKNIKFVRQYLAFKNPC